LLTVENVRQGQGHYLDDIILKTDHKTQPELKIWIRGEINAEKIATITPQEVKLSGSAGEPIKALLKIVPVKAHSFKVLEIKAKSGENICYGLEEVKTAEGMTYHLTVENLKKEKGDYTDAIILKTDSNIKPEIRIKVIGSIFGSDQKEMLNLFESLMKSQK